MKNYFARKYSFSWTRIIGGSLAAVLMFQTVSVPLAEAQQYSSLWQTRQLAVSNLSQSSQSNLKSLPKFSSLNWNTNKISFPSQMATIVESWAPHHVSKFPTVIHIQDIHENFKAQLTNSDILGHIQKSLNIDTLKVGIEGAWSPLDFSPYQNTPQDKWREGVTRAFLENNAISGVHYFALNNPPTKVQVFGLENPEPYLNNLLARRTTVRQRQDMLDSLKFLRKRMDRLARHILPKEIQEHENIRKRYHDKTLGFSDYLSYLTSKSVSLDKFPQIKLFQKLEHFETSLSNKEFSSHRDSLIEKILSTSSQEAKPLLSLAIAHKDGRLNSYQFYREVVFSGERIGLTIPHSVRAMANHLKQRNNLSFAELTLESIKLEEEVSQSLSRKINTYYDLNLFLNHSRSLESQTDLWSLKLTPHIAREAMSKGESLNWIIIEEFLFNLEQQLGLKPTPRVVQPNFRTVLTKAVQFYDLALKRDQYLADNLKSKLNDYKNEKAVILVSGGFHTQGLTNHFKKKNIPYVVVQPNYTSKKISNNPVKLEGVTSDPWNYLEPTLAKALDPYAHSAVKLFHLSLPRSSLPDSNLVNSLQAAHDLGTNKKKKVKSNDLSGSRSNDTTTINLTPTNKPSTDSNEKRPKSNVLNTIRWAAIISIAITYFSLYTFAPEYVASVIGVADPANLTRIVQQIDTTTPFSGFTLAGVTLSYTQAVFIPALAEIAYNVIFSILASAYKKATGNSVVDKNGRVVFHLLLDRDDLVTLLRNRFQSIDEALKDSESELSQGINKLNLGQLRNIYWELDGQNNRQKEPGQAAVSKTWGQAILQMVTHLVNPIYLAKFLKNFFFSTYLSQISYLRTGQFQDRLNEQASDLLLTRLKSNEIIEPYSALQWLATSLSNRLVLLTGYIGYLLKRIPILFIGFIGTTAVSVFLPSWFLNIALFGWLSSYVADTAFGHAVHSADGGLLKYIGIVGHHSNWKIQSVVSAFFNTLGLGLPRTIRGIGTATANNQANPTTQLLNKVLDEADNRKEMSQWIQEAKETGILPRGSDFNSLHNWLNQDPQKPELDGTEKNNFLNHFFNKRGEILLELAALIQFSGNHNNRWFRSLRVNVGDFSDLELTKLRTLVESKLSPDRPFDQTIISQRAAQIEERSSRWLTSSEFLTATKEQLTKKDFWINNVDSMWGMLWLDAEISVVVEGSEDLGGTQGRYLAELFEGRHDEFGNSLGGSAMDLGNEYASLAGAISSRVTGVDKNNQNQEMIQKIIEEEMMATMNRIREREITTPIEAPQKTNPIRADTLAGSGSGAGDPPPNGNPFGFLPRFGALLAIAAFGALGQDESVVNSVGEKLQQWVDENQTNEWPVSNKGDFDIKDVAFLYDISISVRRMLGQGKTKEAKDLLIKILEEDQWRRTSGGLLVDSFDTAKNIPWETKITNGPNMHLAMALMDAWATDPEKDPRLINAAQDIADAILVQGRNGLIPYGPGFQAFPDGRLYASVYNPEYQIDAYGMYYRLGTLTKNKFYLDKAEAALKWLVDNRYDPEARRFWTKNDRDKKGFPPDTTGWAFSMIGPEKLRRVLPGGASDVLAMIRDMGRLPHADFQLLDADQINPLRTKPAFLTEWLTNRTNGLVYGLDWLKTLPDQPALRDEIAQTEQNLIRLQNLLLTLRHQNENRGGGLAYAYAFVDQQGRNQNDPENGPAWTPIDDHVRTGWGWPTQRGSSRISAEYVLSSVIYDHDPVASNYDWENLNQFVPEREHVLRTGKDEFDQPVSDRIDLQVPEGYTYQRWQALTNFKAIRTLSILSKMLADATPWGHVNPHKDTRVYVIFHKSGLNPDKAGLSKAFETKSELNRSYDQLEDYVEEHGPFSPDPNKKGIFATINFMNRVMEERTFPTENASINAPSGGYLFGEGSEPAPYMIIDPNNDNDIVRRFYWMTKEERVNNPLNQRTIKLRFNKELPAEYEINLSYEEWAAQQPGYKVGPFEFGKTDNFTHIVNDQGHILAPYIRMAATDPTTGAITRLYYRDEKIFDLPVAFKLPISEESYERIKKRTAKENRNLGLVQLEIENGQHYEWVVGLNTAFVLATDIRIVNPDRTLGDRIHFSNGLFWNAGSTLRSSADMAPQGFVDGMVISHIPDVGKAKVGNRFPGRVFYRPEVVGIRPDDYAETYKYLELIDKQMEETNDPIQLKILEESFNEGRFILDWLADMEAYLLKQTNRFTENGAPRPGFEAKVNKYINALELIKQARNNYWVSPQGDYHLLVGRQAYLNGYKVFESLTKTITEMQERIRGGNTVPGDDIDRLRNLIEKHNELKTKMLFAYNNDLANPEPRVSTFEKIYRQFNAHLDQLTKEIKQLEAQIQFESNPDKKAELELKHRTFVLDAYRMSFIDEERRFHAIIPGLRAAELRLAQIEEAEQIPPAEWEANHDPKSLGPEIVDFSDDQEEITAIREKNRRYELVYRDDFSKWIEVSNADGQFLYYDILDLRGKLLGQIRGEVKINNQEITEKIGSLDPNTKIRANMFSQVQYDPNSGDKIGEVLIPLGDHGEFVVGRFRNDVDRLIEFYLYGSNDVNPLIKTTIDPKDPNKVTVETRTGSYIDELYDKDEDEPKGLVKKRIFGEGSEIHFSNYVENEDGTFIPGTSEIYVNGVLKSIRQFNGFDPDGRAIFGIKLLDREGVLITENFEAYESVNGSLYLYSREEPKKKEKTYFDVNLEKKIYGFPIEIPLYTVRTDDPDQRPFVHYKTVHSPVSAGTVSELAVYEVNSAAPYQTSEYSGSYPREVQALIEEHNLSAPQDHALSWKRSVYRMGKPGMINQRGEAESLLALMEWEDHKSLTLINRRFIRDQNENILPGEEDHRSYFLKTTNGGFYFLNTRTNEFEIVPDNPDQFPLGYELRAPRSLNGEVESGPLAGNVSIAREGQAANYLMPNGLLRILEFDQENSRRIVSEDQLQRPREVLDFLNPWIPDSDINKMTGHVISITGENDFYWHPNLRKWYPVESTIYRDNLLDATRTLMRNEDGSFAIDPETGLALYQIQPFDAVPNDKAGLLGTIINDSLTRRDNNVVDSISRITNDINTRIGTFVTSLNIPFSIDVSSRLNNLIQPFLEPPYEFVSLEPYFEQMDSDGRLSARRLPPEKIKVINNRSEVRDFYARRGKEAELPLHIISLDTDDNYTDEEVLSEFEYEELEGGKVVEIKRTDKDTGHWDLIRYEYEPYGFQTPFGEYLKWKPSVKQNGVNDTIQKHTVYIYEHDEVENLLPVYQESVEFIHNLRSKNNIAPSISGRQEIGQISLDYSFAYQDPSDPDKLLDSFRHNVSVNMGTEALDIPNGQKINLVKTLNYPEGATTFVRYLDRKGRDPFTDILQGRSSASGHTYNTDFMTWVAGQSGTNEKRLGNYEPYNPNNPDDPEAVLNNGDNIQSQINTPPTIIDGNSFFIDLPYDLTLFEIFEAPSPFVGDRQAQGFSSFTDQYGEKWMEKQVKGNIERISYMPQLRNRVLLDLNDTGDLQFRNQNQENKIKNENADFFFFFARGNEEDMKNIEIDVYVGGKKVDTLAYNHRDPPNGGLWHSDFDDPIVLSHSRANDQVRFMSVTPMNGKVPLWNAGDRPRTIIIPIKWLEQRGIDVNNVSFRISNPEGVQATQIERLLDPDSLSAGPNATSKWNLDAQEQQQWFPKGKPYKKIVDHEPQIQDNKNGIVKIFRGFGTQSKTYVYEFGRFQSLTYWIQNGDDYDHARVSFSDSNSGFLRHPQHIESGYAGWLSAIVTPQQKEGGIRLIKSGNVDQAVAITLLPYDISNFNQPAVSFPPFGLYDPDARFPNANANAPNALFRFLFPYFERSSKGLGNATKIAKGELDKILGPLDYKRFLERLELNIPKEIQSRILITPIPNPDLEEFEIDIQQWADLIKQSQDNRTGLVPTSPDTPREIFVDTKKEGDIIRGLIDAYWHAVNLETQYANDGNIEMVTKWNKIATDRLNSAQKILSFYKNVSKDGNQHILSGYRLNTGSKEQFSGEWKLPGQAVPRANANISIARAAHAVAQASGNPDDLYFATQLATRVIDFTPADNDFLWPHIEIEGKLKEWARDLSQYVWTPPFHNDQFSESHNDQLARRLLSSWDRLKKSLNRDKEIPIPTIEEVEEESQRLEKVKIIIAEARTVMSEDPENSDDLRETYTNRLLELLSKTEEEREVLDDLLNVGGGISEHLPERAIFFELVGVTLQPEPDNYVLETGKEALKLFKEMSHAYGDFREETNQERKFHTQVTVAHRNLETWFDKNVFPTVERYHGNAPSHWRQQLWISGAAPTGLEGKEQPYVTVNGLWPTLKSSLAAAEASFIIDPSEENKEEIRKWLETIYKTYAGVSADGKITGLDYSPETFSRHQGHLFTAELTALFGAISKLVDYEKGEEFARISLQNFKSENNMIVTARGDHNGKVVVLSEERRKLIEKNGIETGDDDRIYLRNDAQDFSWSPTATWRTYQLLNINPEEEDYRDEIKSANLVRAIRGAQERLGLSSFYEKVVNYSTNPLTVVIGIVAALVMIINRLVWSIWVKFKNNNSRSRFFNKLSNRLIRDIFVSLFLMAPTVVLFILFGINELTVPFGFISAYISYQLINSALFGDPEDLWSYRDLSFATILLLGIPAIFLVFDVSGLAFSLSAAWLYPIHQLISTMKWKRRYDTHYVPRTLLYKSEKFKNDDSIRIYSNKLLKASNDRFYKRVIGNYPVKKGDEVTGIVGSSAPRQFPEKVTYSGELSTGEKFNNERVTIKPGEHIGTVETQFVGGLNYVHFLTLEYFARKNINNEQWKTFAEERSISTNDPDWIWKVIAADPAPLLNDDNYEDDSGDIRELRLLDRYIRRSGEWFRRVLAAEEDEVNTEIYALTNMFFSFKAEELREILAAPLRDPNRETKELTPEEETRFEAILQEIGALDPDQVSMNDYTNMINSFADKYDLKSIHPNWFEYAHSVPRFIIYAVTFAFINSWDALSPVDLFINSVISLNPTVQLAGIIMTGIGIFFYISSILIYRVDDFRMEHKRRKWRAKNSFITQSLLIISQLNKSILVRNIFSFGLFIGILGIGILLPGLDSLIIPGQNGIILDINNTILPGVLALLFFVEAFGIYQGRISPTRLTAKIQFGPASDIGSIRTILMYLVQYLGFLLFSWGVSAQVVPYFIGYLGAPWGLPVFQNSDFNIVSHIIGISVISLALISNYVQMRKKEIPQPTKRQLLATYVAGLFGIFVVLAPFFGDVPRLISGESPVIIGAALFSPLGSARNKRHGILKKPMIVSFLIGLLVAYLDINRPLGGFAIGLLSLMVAFSLANFSIHNAVIGPTAITKAIGSRFRNFVELGFLLGLFYVLGWVVPIPYLSFLFKILFYIVGLTTVIALGDPSFSLFTFLSAIVGYVLPVGWFAPYFQALFILLAIGGIISRILRWVIAETTMRMEIKGINLNDIEDESFGIINTGGQPSESIAAKTRIGFQNKAKPYAKANQENMENKGKPLEIPDKYVNHPKDDLYIVNGSFYSFDELVKKAINEGAKANLNRDLGYYRGVMKANSVSSDKFFIDEDGKNYSDSDVEAALKLLFRMEATNMISLWDEEQIHVKGQPYTENQQLVVNNNTPNTQVKVSITPNFIFEVENKEEAQQLKMGMRLHRHIATLNGGGFQRDSFFSTLQMLKAAQAAGHAKKIVFYIQSNKYNDSPPDNKGDPVPYNLMKGARTVEFDERRYYAEYLQTITGIKTVVTHNWTPVAMKSGAQFGNDGSFSKLKHLMILDRNAQTFTIRQLIEDQRKFWRNPNLSVVFPRRSTSNEIYATGKMSGKNEYGFTMYQGAMIDELGGRDGEMISIGWATTVRLPFNDLLQAYADPGFSYRFFAEDFVDAIYGGVHGMANFTHQSEDYVQAQVFAEQMKALGYQPEIGTSNAFYFKMREVVRMVEMVTARPRWSGGGDVGQKGRDIYIQRLRELGTDSIFKKEMQRNRGRYYGLAQMSMANVILMPALILSGYTPFAGILLIFWFIGIGANQILTLNGWASYIHRAGFIAGTAIWISERFSDTIQFAPLNFIERFGVDDTFMKDKAYSFAFGISGAADSQSFSDPNIWARIHSDPGTAHLFRWMFMTGVFATALNLYAIGQALDQLNVIMLYPTLIFSVGLMLGSYLYAHYPKPGKSFFSIKTWLPKILGFITGLLVIGLLSIGLGTWVQDPIPFTNLFYADIIFAIGYAILMSVLPGRIFVVAPGKNPENIGQYTLESKFSNDDIRIRRNQIFHNLSVLSIWIIITLATFFGFYFFWKDTFWLALLSSITPFYKSVRIMTNRPIKVSNKIDSIEAQYNSILSHAKAQNNKFLIEIMTIFHGHMTDRFSTLRNKIKEREAQIPRKHKADSKLTNKELEIKSRNFRKNKISYRAADKWTGNYFKEFTKSAGQFYAQTKYPNFNGLDDSTNEAVKNELANLSLDTHRSASKQEIQSMEKTISEKAQDKSLDKKSIKNIVGDFNEAVNKRVGAKKSKKDKKQYQRFYFSETFKRTVILTVIAFIWFVVVPSPALMTARVLNYNMTINYVQLFKTILFTSTAIITILVLGALTYNLTLARNKERFRKLMKKFKDRKESNTLTPGLITAIEASIQGVIHAPTIRGSVVQADHLDEIERALKTKGPDFDDDYFKTLRPKDNGPKDESPRQPGPKRKPNSKTKVKPKAIKTKSKADKRTVKAAAIDKALGEEEGRDIINIGENTDEESSNWLFFKRRRGKRFPFSPWVTVGGPTLFAAQIFLENTTYAGTRSAPAVVKEAATSFQTPTIIGFSLFVVAGFYLGRKVYKVITEKKSETFENLPIISGREALETIPLGPETDVTEFPEVPEFNESNVTSSDKTDLSESAQSAVSALQKPDNSNESVTHVIQIYSEEEIDSVIRSVKAFNFWRGRKHNEIDYVFVINDDLGQKNRKKLQKWGQLVHFDKSSDKNLGDRLVYDINDALQIPSTSRQRYNLILNHEFELTVSQTLSNNLKPYVTFNSLDPNSQYPYAKSLLAYYLGKDWAQQFFGKLETFKWGTSNPFEKLMLVLRAA